MWQQTVNLCESKLGSIPNRGAKIWGIHILGIMPALHVGQESSILSSSTKHWVSGEVGESRETVNLFPQDE